MKEGRAIILAVVLFRCESEITLFGLPKEDTTRNQCLSSIYNTVAFYEKLFPESGRVAYNPNSMKGFEHYKVGQFQLCKDSLVLLTHSL